MEKCYQPRPQDRAGSRSCISRVLRRCWCWAARQLAPPRDGAGRRRRDRTGRAQRHPLARRAARKRRPGAARSPRAATTSSSSATPDQASTAGGKPSCRTFSRSSATSPNARRIDLQSAATRARPACGTWPGRSASCAPSWCAGAPRATRPRSTSRRRPSSRCSARMVAVDYVNAGRLSRWNWRCRPRRLRATWSSGHRASAVARRARVPATRGPRSPTRGSG